MYNNYESIPETNTPGKKTHIIDYPGLMSTAQLSAARLVDVEGSLDAEFFSDLLIGKTKVQEEEIMAEVGIRFDDALVSFVTAILISRHHERVVILADASEGFNGYLPWQEKLEKRFHDLKARGTLQDIELQVERFSTDDQAIEQLTQQARALAVEKEPAVQ